MSKKASTSQELLEALFFDAGQVTEMEMAPKLDTDKVDPALDGAARKGLESKLPELEKLLGKVGVKDVKDRLALCQGAFRLSCASKEQHAEDSDLLFDLTKIDPLIDKGYVVIDAESDEDGGMSIIILAADTEFEVADLADTDDLEASTVDLKDEGATTEPSTEITDLAEKLVSEAISRLR